MSSIFSNPSIVQTQLRIQYTNGASPGVVAYDSQPRFSTFSAPTNTSDLRTVTEDIVLSATTASTALPVPSQWTKVTKVTVINLDSYNGVRVSVTDAGTNKTAYDLPPNGGTYMFDAWPLSAVGTTATTGNTPVSWSLYGIDGGGYTIPAAYPTSVRVILHGYI